MARKAAHKDIHVPCEELHIKTIAGVAAPTVTVPEINNILGQIYNSNCSYMT